MPVRFFQVLEGDRQIVTDLFNKIATDQRHIRVVKIILEPIEERNFGEWTMGYPRISRREIEKLPGFNDFFTGGNTFIDLEPGRAKTLLRAFKDGKWHSSST